MTDVTVADPGSAPPAGAGGVGHDWDSPNWVTPATRAASFACAALSPMVLRFSAISLGSVSLATLPLSNGTTIWNESSRGSYLACLVCAPLASAIIP